MGLQTFDENGNIMLDTNDRLCRHCGTFNIRKGRQFIEVEKEKEEKMWWCFLNEFAYITSVQEVQNGIWIDSESNTIMILGVY